MKRTNNFLSVITLILLIVSIIPIGRYTVIAKTQDCGPAVIWDMNASTGVLTISGTGKMYDYSYGNAPWYSYHDDIRSVKIEGEVNSIGDHAFYLCHKLTSINIPDSITSIGYGAFSGCYRLDYVIMPVSVTFIGSYAFSGCTNLSSITIPNNVATIGHYAFWNCTRLTSVTIPNSVTSIGECAFLGCAAVKSVIIGNSVTWIGNAAFFGCSHTSINIPASVDTVFGTSLGAGLESITVESNNKTYHSDKNCLIETETKALIIGCKNSIIPSDGSVISIGEKAFLNCGINTINIPNSVTSIGDSAFFGSGLTSITIPDSVTSIGSSAFDSSKKIVSVKMPNLISSISDNIFANCDNLTSISMPESATNIGEWAFAHCPKLTSIKLPNAVTTIGNYAFNGCHKLNSVIMPCSLKNIGNNAFDDCSVNNVYYAGSIELKLKISINSNNDCIQSAIWHYNCNPDYITCTHEETQIVGEKSATCTEQGYTGDICCKNCGWKLATGETTKIIGHDFASITDDQYLKIAADYTHSAVYYKSCSRCGEKSSETFESDIYMSCGENSGFIINENTISIRGSGKTDGYKTSGSVPWYDYADLVNNIVVNEGITVLGNYAFNCFVNLDSVIIKNKDITFGKYVFNTDAGMTVFAQGGGNIEEYCNNNGIDFIDISMSAPTPKLVSYTASNITLIHNKLLEYSIDNINWQNSNTFEGLLPATKYNVYARYIPTADIYNNVSEPLVVKTDKKTIAAPPEPICIRNTDTEITLKANPNYEYSIDGENWQKSNVFSGLIHGNTYSLYQRLAETETNYASPSSEPLVIQLVKKTASAPTAPDYQSHTDNSITLAPNELYEFSIDGENWQRSNMFTGLSKNVIYSFYQRVAETETEYASESSAALIIAIPDNPKILEAGYENILVKLVDGFEYCLDDFVWQDNNTFDMLLDNTEYYVYQRLKAVDGEKVYQIISDYTVVKTDNSIIHNHTIGEWLTTDANHWNICDVCGKKIDEAPHMGGMATCIEKAKCSICGAEYGEYAAHHLTHHDCVEPDYENDGSIEYWTCDECGKYFSDSEGNNEISADDVIIAKLIVSKYQFIDGEVIVEAPAGAIPEGSLFDVQKIVPPPSEIVGKVKEQMGASSEVLAYYEIRLYKTDGTLIIHLDGEITIKTKMPEQYVGSKCVRILQEDETGKLIVMESWWENDYLCYKADWLEIYN